jgi:3-oxoacyl-[acyl-carrier-protein] synthase-3
MGSAILARAGSPRCRILGVGGYRPRRVVTNDELSRFLDTSDDWIRRRTGIVTRHWAEPDETLDHMATTAAERALAYAKVPAEGLGCVIVATFTHMLQTPAVATAIAHRLGAVEAAAFDISAGCAGFTHALSLASSIVHNDGTHVLVVGAERMTDLLDMTDRSTAVIFGDGAGAVVVGPSAEPGIGPTVWGSDGSQADAITQTSPWGAPAAADAARPALRQDGQRVFRWAVGEMAQVAKQALEAAGIQAADLDAFIPHQANVRIIDRLVDAIGIPDGARVARDVERAGNTSGASIPLAMDSLVSGGLVRSGDVALLLGFGAGLSYAAMVVTLP